MHLPGTVRVVPVLCLVTIFVDGYGTPARADQGGSGFWLMGSYASQAAIASAPGLTVDTAFYSSAAYSKRTTAYTWDGRIEEGLETHSNYLLVTPSYALETQVLGGQFEFGATFLWGNYSSSVSETLHSPGGSILGEASTDSMTAAGDVFPEISLKWNRDVHNLMVYVGANVPVGAYDSNRQAYVGMGFWAIDGGVGYTYYDDNSGHEFSAVLGFTYNFMNQTTLYQNGIDMHLELSASQYVTDRLLLGVAGYLYNQITPDSGPGAELGSFMSRVAGVGPQIGYDFTLGGKEASVAARGYYEFAGQNRPEGWTAWLNLTIAFGPFSHKLAKGR